MLNTSKDNSKFYEHPSYDHPNYSNNDNLDYSLNLKFPLIPKLKDPNIHYRCPKCYYFPYIEFITNQEDITYFCHCSKDTKYLSIKDLFVPKNEYLTFLNNRNENKNKGFLCIIHKSDNSNKNRKFKYFCITCKDNICKDCLLYHLKNSHDVINLEIQKLETNKKINSINKKLIEIKKEIEEIDNSSSDEDKINTIKLEKLENGNYKKITSENNKVILDNFMELINIIINDYIEYPNYYLKYQKNIINILYINKMIIIWIFYIIIYNYIY